MIISYRNRFAIVCSANHCVIYLFEMTSKNPQGILPTTEEELAKNMQKMAPIEFVKAVVGNPLLLGPPTPESVRVYHMYVDQLVEYNKKNPPVEAHSDSDEE